MTKTRVYCVVTTIYDFAFLVDFARASTHPANEHLDVTFIVIIDKKTDPSIESNIRQARSLGLRVECPSLDAQLDFLKKLGLQELVPYHSDNRRNIGFLMACAAACDVLISLDDDNRPVAGHPFYSEHVDGLRLPPPAQRLTTPSSWFNVCGLLHIEPALPVFPRGFPYSQRATSTDEIVTDERDGVVGVNVGMWIEDPDVDAVTRLAVGPRAVSLKRPSVTLSRSTWTPINTQNTSLPGELIPAYYYLWMGDMGNGRKLDRFGDIWSGYFLQAVMKSLGYVTRVGTPVVEHLRTTHDIIRDLHYELPGIELTEGLAEWLPTLHLSVSTPAEAYEALSHALDEETERFSGWAWDREARLYMHKLAGFMRLWLQGIRQCAS